MVDPIEFYYCGKEITPRETLWEYVESKNDWFKNSFQSLTSYCAHRNDTPDLFKVSSLCERCAARNGIQW